MANHGRELASLDFRNMIGGPLGAVVQAQSDAAMTTVGFIQNVGFEESDDGGIGKPVMVKFRYQKEIKPFEPATDDKPASPAEYQEQELEVPLLTMVPIPFIRVDSTEIEFNAKINSVHETSHAKESEAKLSVGAKGGWGPVSVNVKASYSQKRSSTSGSKVERTYAMSVKVRAVQDEIPAGMDRVLAILEDSIASTPAA